MTRRRGITRRSGVQKGEYIWTAVLGIDILSTILVQSANIVEDGDWSVSAGRQGATLIAIRGWWGCQHDPVGGAESNTVIGLAIEVQDEDIGAASATQDPLVVGTLIDEDILWTGGWATGFLLFASGVGSVYTASTPPMQFDVKAKRKLKTGSQVRIVHSAVTDNEIKVNFSIRALLKVN